MKNIFFLLILAWIPFKVNSQNEIKGKVTESNGTLVFAANVFCKENIYNGTTTDFDGEFELKMPCDTLCFSFIGFRQKCIAVADMYQNDFVVILEAEDHFLTEALVKATDPISNKFSVVKLDKIAIYQNPLSAGDPLKAITALPASTNSDESANPVLRGSSADRSRVVVNGVPIRNPVRNGQLNGLGNFSLLNAEIVDKLYVYASNPPLTYGGTTAGLVEVETNKELDKNIVQGSVGMANLGVFISQKVKKNNFFQLYSNYQFSDTFLKLNKANLPRLKDFGSLDAGLNMKAYTSKKSYWNSFSYFIDEFYQAQANLFTYEGLTNAGKKRFFTINNWNLKLKNGLFRLSSLVDVSRQDFSFGNLKSNLKNAQVYSSADYKRIWENGMIFQCGTNFSNWNYSVNNRYSQYYYAVTPSAPVVYQDTLIQNKNLESYVYFNWDLNEKMAISSGWRINVPLFQDPFYQSAQVSFKYEPNAKNRFLLSTGKYYNYSTPNFSSQSFDLLESFQLALDYDYHAHNFNLLSAVFYKSEAGNLVDANQIAFDQSKIFGVEFFFSKNLGKFFDVSFANTFLNHTVVIQNESFRGNGNFIYFGKLSLQYNNPSIITATLSYINRPGKYYTPIVNGDYDPTSGFYIPIFDDTFNAAQYNTYSNLSFSCSRYFPINNNALIAFFSVNNILNRKNESEDLYNQNYSNRFYDYYQLRTIYLGFVFQASR